MSLPQCQSLMILMLFCWMMKTINKMDDRINYQILSHMTHEQKSKQFPYQQFHRSVPLKPNPKKQEQSSLALLSSMMQTENLLMNKRTSPSEQHTTKEGGTFVTQKGASLPQTAKRFFGDKFQTKSAYKMELLAQTRQRLLKKECALLNILGEYDPGEHTKKDNKVMQETIYKARTYTDMPANATFLPLYKKRQNHLKMKQEFTNFLKRQDWKEQMRQLQNKNRVGSEPSMAEYINRTDKHTQNKTKNTGDLYNFLQNENTRMKRLKTHQPTQQNRQVSKRMTYMILKSELKIFPEPFNLTKVGKRKNFQLKAES